MFVVYNGVALNYVNTTRWEETVEYDPSGTDLIGNKVSMTFEGSLMNSLGSSDVMANGAIIVNSELDRLDVAALPNAVNNMAEYTNRVLRALQTPRKNLYVYLSYWHFLNDRGNPLFMAITSDVTAGEVGGQIARNVDVDQGPKPRSASLKNTWGTYASISFSIETTKIRCLKGEINDGTLGGNPASDLIVYHRYYLEESIDENFYTTRVFTGSMRISSAKWPVHCFRSLVYPQLEVGFRRQSVKFNESADGLVLSYSVVDKQCRNSAPYPATDFKGRVTVNYNSPAETYISMYITLTGGPDCHRGALRELALAAITRRINNFLSADKTGGYISKLSAAENLEDPPTITAEAAMRVYSTQADVNYSDGANVNHFNVAPWHLSLIKKIGQEVDFSDVKFSGSWWRRDVQVSEYEIRTYDRTRSQKPSPNGYSVFGVTTNEEETSDMKRAFIRCVAQTPCYIPDADAYGTVSGQSGIPNVTSTYLKEVSEPIEFNETPTEIEPQCVYCPYSTYAYKIETDSDSSNVQLPKAKPVDKAINDPYGEETGVPDDSQVISQDKALSYSNFAVDALVACAGIAGFDADMFYSYDSSTRKYTFSDITPGAYSMLSSEHGSDSLSSLDWYKLYLKYKKLYENEIQKTSPATSHIVKISDSLATMTITIDAERYGRIPEFPDPDKVVNTAGIDPIQFTCLSNSVSNAEPRPSLNSMSEVCYAARGVYKYAMSRPYRRGDEVWILKNPLYQYPFSYYPQNADGSFDTTALTAMYEGASLNHPALPNG